MPTPSRSTVSSPAVVRANPTLAASRLLAEYEERYGTPHAPPIPVGEIARAHLILWVSEHDDLRLLDGAPKDLGRISGLLDPGAQTIWIDRAEAARSDARRRFTIAHEIGHWILHTNNGREPAKLHCRPADLRRRDHREGEANMFASALLMPEPLLRPAAEDCGCNIAHLARSFAVSSEAMRLALLHLDLLPPWMRA
jgi:hypothetical protein